MPVTVLQYSLLDIGTPRGTAQIRFRLLSSRTPYFSQGIQYARKFPPFFRFSSFALQERLQLRKRFLIQSFARLFKIFCCTQSLLM